MAFFLRSDSYLFSSFAQFNFYMQLSRVLRSRLLWWQYDLRFPSLVSMLVLVFLLDYLSTWDQKRWLSKERLEIYSPLIRIGLYSNKLVQLTSFQKVIEGYPSPIKLRISSVSIGASSISEICSTSLDFILILLSWISFISSSLILSCISSQKLLPTPMLACSTTFPLYPSISRLSWLRSYLNLYIFPISKSSIFLNSALHPHWQFNPSKISEMFFCWSPISLTTLNCSSFCDGSRADGLERSLSLSILETPVVLLDLRVMNSFMVSLERTEEKFEWLGLSMECSIDQQIITSAIKFISSKGSQKICFRLTISLDYYGSRAGLTYLNHFFIFSPSKPIPSSPIFLFPFPSLKTPKFHSYPLYSIIIKMQNEDNQQLLRKYQRKESFYRQMQSISKRFQQFQQQVYYSPIKDINEHMILKIQGKNQQKRTYILKKEDLYVINGQYQPSGQKSFERLILQIVQCIPRPKNSFGIIYVNTLTDSNAYNDFKKVMEMLPIQYLFHLTKIIVLEASFLNKAFTWLSFGTATAYIKNKTINVENLRELSQESHLDIEYIRKILPKNVVQAQLKNEMKESPQQQREMFPLRVTPNPQFALMTRGPVNQEEDQVPGQITRVKSDQPQKKGRFAPIEWGEVKSTKPQKPVRKQMSQYQIGPSGAPMILEMLIYFFTNNESYLKLQGLFRKSVSIDDQNEIIQQLNKRNYNFIASVDNPHVIANAIKRFISFFKTPIIPYPMFELFMQKEGSPDFVHIVRQNIKQLPQVNRMTIFLLFDFLKNRVLPFAQHSKMGENNLCIVFGPCLMRSEIASMRELIYAKKVIVVTSIIFKQFQNIFGDIHQQEKMRTNSYKQYRLSQNNQRESREVFKPTDPQQPQKSQEDKQKEKQEMSVLHQTSALIKQSYENDQEEPSPEPPTPSPQSLTISANPKPTPFTAPQIQ